MILNDIWTARCCCSSCRSLSSFLTRFSSCRFRRNILFLLTSLWYFITLEMVNDDLSWFQSAMLTGVCRFFSIHFGSRGLGNRAVGCECDVNVNEVESHWNDAEAERTRPSLYNMNKLHRAHSRYHFAVHLSAAPSRIWNITLAVRAQCLPLVSVFQPEGNRKCKRHLTLESIKYSVISALGIIYSCTFTFTSPSVRTTSLVRVRANLCAFCENFLASWFLSPQEHNLLYYRKGCGVIQSLILIPPPEWLIQTWKITQVFLY